MVRRDDLVALFEKEAKPKGWRMDLGDFPHDIEGEVFPHSHNIFKALSLISPAEVKFLILGQDPYFTSTGDEPDATGVAFAISATSTKMPPSLNRIMKKVYHGDAGNRELTDWICERGVLLLNAALTVPAGNRRECAGAHFRDGMWKAFVRSIILQVEADTNSKVIFIAWGNKAKKVMKDVLGSEAKFIGAHHPVASTSGEGSFENFWGKKEVARLVMPREPGN